MRIIVQRVEKARVSVGEKNVGAIDNGLFILVGITSNDTNNVADKLAEKIVNLRIMSDDSEKMNLSVKDTNSSILVVSQFTLYADTKKGNRPSFVKAADPHIAKQIYQHFIDKLIGYGINVKTGIFGEYMKIDATMDGPVTIIFDSQNE